MGIEQESPQRDYSQVVSIRPFYTGTLGGILIALSLALPLYLVLPAYYIAEWSQIAPAVGVVGYVLAALFALATGYVSACWSWAETTRARIRMGALAGAVAGTVSWIMIGSAAAGIVGHAPIWFQVTHPVDSEDSSLILLAEAIVRTIWGQQITFWVSVAAGALFGISGGWLTTWKASIRWDSEPRPIHAVVWVMSTVTALGTAFLASLVPMWILSTLTYRSLILMSGS
jgi:hypothetical protein